MTETPKRIICTISGGIASAWCAKWALENFEKDKVILYFNDTKWEDEDLYRFLNDIEKHLDHPITRDSDGRSVEELFKDSKALANDRMAFCSKILKAKRLQRFYQDGDLLLFGIGPEETYRSDRIISLYKKIQREKKKKCTIRFPLIEENVSRKDLDAFLDEANIKRPRLYDLGFSHNNCSGGCVRAGKIQWKKVLDKLPGVYKERERVERELRELTGKDITIMRGETLEEFRKRAEAGKLSKRYLNAEKAEMLDECVGVCNTVS